MDARSKTDGTWVNMHNDDNLPCCVFVIISWKQYSVVSDQWYLFILV